MTTDTAAFPERVKSKASAWILLSIFALMMGIYASFVPGTGWNATSRLALTINIVQKGSVYIDGYEEMTGDKASYAGHFFSDKAPGMSLMAIPAAAVVNFIHPLVPQDIAKNSSVWIWLNWICTLSVSGLVSSLACVALFSHLFSMTRRIDVAVVGVASFGLATPVFGWSTLFFGHATSASFLLLGYILLDGARQGKIDLRWSALGGLCLGLSTCVEYTAGVSSAIIVLIMAVSDLRTFGLRMAAPRYLAIGFGGLLGLAPALVYNTLAFGGPFSLGYGHVVGFDGMQTGFFGINLPSAKVAWEILFGLRRGLFWMCPLFVVMLALTARSAWDRSTRAVAITGLALFAWYVLLNSSYVYWDGGYSTGPRHLTPSVSVLTLAFALAWAGQTRLVKAVSIVFLIGSMFLNFAATSIDMMSDTRIENPMAGIVEKFVHMPTGDYAFYSLAWIAAWLIVFVVNVKVTASQGRRASGWMKASA